MLAKLYTSSDAFSSSRIQGFHVGSPRLHSLHQYNSCLASFSWSWHFWSILVRYLKEMSFNWICLIFTPDFIGVVILGKNTTVVPFSSYNIISGSTWYYHSLLLVMVTDFWVKMVHVRFHTVNVNLLVFPSYTLFISCKSLSPAPRMGEKLSSTHHDKVSLVVNVNNNNNNDIIYYYCYYNCYFFLMKI